MGLGNESYLVCIRKKKIPLKKDKKESKDGIQEEPFQVVEVQEDHSFSSHRLGAELILWLPAPPVSLADFHEKSLLGK